MSTQPLPQQQPDPLPQHNGGAAKTQPVSPLANAVMSASGFRTEKYEELWHLSKLIIVGGFSCKGDTVESVWCKIQFGRELGMPDMQSVQNIAVINGHPSVWGDMLIALCRQSGKFDEAGYSTEWTGKFPNDDFTAVCKVKRTNSPNQITRTFSITDAKRAGLWGKAGPWTQYPIRQLMWRSQGFAVRDGFNDVLKGVYSREEMIDSIVEGIDFGNGVPPDPEVTKIEALTERIKKHRKQEAKAPEAAQPPAVESDEPPAVAVTPAEPTTDPEPPPTSEPPPVDRDALVARVRELGTAAIEHPDMAKIRAAYRISGFDGLNLKKLTVPSLQALAELLEQLP